MRAAQEAILNRAVNSLLASRAGSYTEQGGYQLAHEPRKRGWSAYRLVCYVAPVWADRKNF